MPAAIIPLVAAAGSIGAGMAAVGGTMAGFAAAGIGTQLVAGAMIAGGAMTAVGAISGSKKLMKYGGLLSLAGGVGGLATGAWSAVASEVAGTAGMTAPETAAFMEANTATLQGADSAMSGMAGMGGTTSNTPIGGMPGMGADSGMYDAVAKTGMAESTLPAGVKAPGTVAQQGMTEVIEKAVPKSGSSGMLSDAVTWAQQGNNPRLVQAGAGLLQSGLGAYGQQEAAKEQIKMREEAEARARQRMNDSVKGIRVPTYQPRG